MASVLTWNVAGRVRSVAAQADAVAEREFDVIALQEVRSSAVAAWEAALRAQGYTSIAATLAADSPRAAPERRLGVLVAARVPLEVQAPLELPWPERHIAVALELDGEPVVLHNVHVPTSARSGNVKVLTLEALYAHVAPRTAQATLIAGDLNTPAYESREGEVRSFARTRTGNLRAGFEQRHDDAELALIVALRDWGFADAFRELHGYERRDRSWLYPNGKTGFRLDHILVRGLAVAQCEYEHSWRIARLSDHSAMWARLLAR